MPTPFVDTLSVLCSGAAVFVHSNKVLTGQYFLWYMALLPTVWPKLRAESRRKRRAVKGLAAWWGAAVVAWLATAYLLEFRGAEVWAWLWACSGHTPRRTRCCERARTRTG